jgi:hypothetical protein
MHNQAASVDLIPKRKVYASVDALSRHLKLPAQLCGAIASCGAIACLYGALVSAGFDCEALV